MSLLSIDQLTRETIDTLFESTRHMEIGDLPHNIARGKILIPLFLEPSTRTRLSFETAMLRLGGQVLPLPSINELSIAKGESIPDTMRVLSGFGDVIVMRTPDEATLFVADKYSSVPVISGGNGCDEHPTQTLLDLYTIHKEKGQIDGLHVALVGDLKHARTMHSLIKGLAYYDVTLHLVAPDALRAPAELIDLLQQRQVAYLETEKLEEGLGQIDVLYIVMLQHHRIADHQLVEHLRRNYYCITPDVLKRAKPDIIILHPLVRREEVSTEVDALPQAAYFRQVRNGVFVRMALLAQTLGPYQ